MDEEKTVDESEEILTLYKEELARIYKNTTAKKAQMTRRKMPNLAQLLAQCDREMREDIEELKKKYGIHY